MRRGWILAGVVIAVAAPSVPVAAAGVSLVLKRVNGSDGDEVGKWIRTGDVQRFRVRLNGMAEEARVAVAASPVGALSEVACVPSAERSVPLDARPSATGAAVPPSVVVPEAEAGDEIVRPRTAARALAARALAVAGTSSSLPAGTWVCRLGRIAGERSVDVTLTAPEGVRKVVLAAVARTRAGSEEDLTIMRRTVATRVTDVVPTISGRATKLTTPTGSPTTGAAEAGADLSATTVGPVGNGGAEADGGAAVGPVGNGGAEADGGAAVGRGTRGAATVEPESGGVAAVEGEQSGGDAPTRRAGGTVLDPGLTLPPATPQQAGVVPSPQIAALPGTEPETGAAPLPWEMAAATKRAQPAGWVSPLKGALGHSLAVGAIAALLGALWVIVTVQKHRKRRMVL